MELVGVGLTFLSVSFLRIYVGLCCLGRLRSVIGHQLLAVIAFSLSLFLLSRPEQLQILREKEGFLGLRPYLLLLFTNLVSGALSMIPLGLLSEVMPMGARLIDVMRGNNYAEQILPGAETRHSPLELLATVASFSVILIMGIHLPYLRQLLQANELALEYSQGVLLCGHSLSSALRFALPSLLSLGVLEVSLALLSRFFPRIPIAAEFQSLRLLLGLLIAAHIFGSLLPEFLLAEGGLFHWN